MEELFDTRPVRFLDGVLTASGGVLLMLVLRGEKILLRRLQGSGDRS